MWSLKLSIQLYQSKCEKLYLGHRSIKQKKKKYSDGCQDMDIDVVHTKAEWWNPNPS